MCNYFSIICFLSCSFIFYLHNCLQFFLALFEETKTKADIMRHGPRAGAALQGGGSLQLCYHYCSWLIPGHTTRAPQVGFKQEAKGFQFYAIANLDKTSLQSATLKPKWDSFSQKKNIFFIKKKPQRSIL